MGIMEVDRGKTLDLHLSRFMAQTRIFSTDTVASYGHYGRISQAEVSFTLVDSLCMDWYLYFWLHQWPLLLGTKI